MRVLNAAPFGAMPTREEWLARSRAGALDVPEPWLDSAQRWFLPSTLSRSSRTQTHFALIKIGRWLAHEHPDRAEPGSWDRQLAAAWVARVDRMLVGEYSRAPNTDYMRPRSGGQLLPRTKAHLMWAPRRDRRAVVSDRAGPRDHDDVTVLRAADRRDQCACASARSAGNNKPTTRASPSGSVCSTSP